MTTWYEGICVLGHKVNIPKGGGFTYIQLVCDTCGSYSDWPRYIPREFPQEMSQSEFAAYLALGQRKWPRSGRHATAAEKAFLDKITRRCECGGHYVSEYEGGASYRCPECKSDRFKHLGMSGVASD